MLSNSDSPMSFSFPNYKEKNRHIPAINKENSVVSVFIPKVPKKSSLLLEI